MAGPSRFAESFVALLLPPPRREDILGDLYERYQSPSQYFLRALSVVPFVILGQVRRMADARIIAMEAVSTYVGFLGAALATFTDVDPSLLAVPAAVTVAAMRFVDVYSKPAGPAIGVLIAFAFLYSWLPLRVLLIGSMFSFGACTGIRIFFAPGPGQMRGN